MLQCYSSLRLLRCHALLTMVLLNVAATRGPGGLWPGYRMQNFAPTLTLRDVGEMVLPADHSDISRVEGRSRMDDNTTSDITGALDCDVKSVFRMGVTAINMTCISIEFYYFN